MLFETTDGSANGRNAALPSQGVASLLEYKCVEAAFPEMSARALFQLSLTPLGAPPYLRP